MKYRIVQVQRKEEFLYCKVQYKLWFWHDVKVLDGKYSHFEIIPAKILKFNWRKDAVDYISAIPSATIEPTVIKQV